MLRAALLTFALLGLGQSAFAQINPAPTGGGQFLHIPPAPMPQRVVPEIRIEKGAVPAIPAADSVRILVKALRITGQTLYPETELLALTGFRPGTQQSLAELRAMATKIAEHYHRNGYFVAQAYLPAQDLTDGIVTIAVLEGRYGSIILRNQTNLSESLANGLLAGLNPGDTIAIAPLETRLLLLSDLPGVVVKSTLVPGASVGTSDLIVEITPGRRVTGSVDADNGGSRYTGEYRVGGTVHLNNLLGQGDVASLRVLTSGSGLIYGRASYQAQFGRATLGVAYTALDYELGKEFKPVGAHGTARIWSVYGSYPLIRSRNTNLYGLVSCDAKTFRDETDVPVTLTDKKVNVCAASLYGHHRDGLGAGGLTSYALTGSAGDVDIRTPAALVADQLGPRSNGHFGKLAYRASRLQNITDRFSLFAGINGQFASKNLDISEKMSLGGPYGVRAYPVGEAYADEGYIVNLEARYRLPKFSQGMPGQMHLVGFVDTGGVKINKDPWLAGDNHRSLSAAGFGLTWAEINNFSLSAYWAHRLGNEKATSGPDSSSRIWVQGIKFF